MYRIKIKEKKSNLLNKNTLLTSHRTPIIESNFFKYNIQAGKLSKKLVLERYRETRVKSTENMTGQLYRINVNIILYILYVL